MRKAVLFLLVVVLIFCSLASVEAFQNEPDGFRGLKWGDATREEMVLVETFSLPMEKFRALNVLDIYTRPDEKMYIGRIPLFKVVYCFLQNKFVAALVYYKSKVNYEDLKIILFVRYEEPGDLPPGFMLAEYQWTGETSIIYLRYNYEKKDGLLLFLSPILLKEANKAMANEAKGDF